MNSSNDVKNGKQFWKVMFDELPTTLDELRSLPEANLKQPHYVAALLIPILCLWSTNQGLVLDMLNFLKGPQELSMHEKQFIEDRLRGKEYLPFSYFEGTSPQNGYKPSRPYTITISTVPTSFNEAGYAKLYLKSSGADSPRPVQIRKKESSGEWFLWEQMILSDIRQPVLSDPWS